MKSTLILSNVTSEYYGNIYRCVATKIDIPSTYLNALHTLHVRSAKKDDVNFTGVIPLPSATALNVSWLEYYNDDEKACSLESNCVAAETIMISELEGLSCLALRSLNDKRKRYSI